MKHIKRHMASVKAEEKHEPEQQRSAGMPHYEYAPEHCCKTDYVYMENGIEKRVPLMMALLSPPGKSSGSLYMCSRDVSECVGYAQPKELMQNARRGETKAAEIEDAFSSPHTVWAKRQRARGRAKVDGGRRMYGKEMLYVDSVAVARMLARAGRTCHVKEFVAWLLSATVTMPITAGSALPLAEFAEHYVPQQEPKEVVYCRAIERTCAGRAGSGNMHRLHRCGAYQLDMAYLDAMLVIECDESGHADRDERAERAREREIFRRGYGGIYRFDPDAAGVDEFAVAADVLLILGFAAAHGGRLPAPAEQQEQAGMVRAGRLVLPA